MKPILTDKAESRRLLGGIGATKFDEMIASGEVESVLIGRRRLIKISSLERLAGIEVDAPREV
jgi:hypothetical protein